MDAFRVVGLRLEIFNSSALFFFKFPKKIKNTPKLEYK